MSKPSDQRSTIRRLWEKAEGSPNLLSTASSFSAPVGPRISTTSLGGYYIDFSFKAKEPTWPPPWLGHDGGRLHVAAAQWGLGCYERYLAGEGDAWLAAARRTADHLDAEQQTEGPQRGGWVHEFRHRHTFPLEPPWLSGMAQGEGASLLLRVHRETGEERYAQAARLALDPMEIPSAEGGVRANLGGGFFPEEYPTSPPSLVLNGGLFALWGCFDVALALDDPRARELWEEGLATLAAHIDDFDTGYWSRYDLFPHPVANIASAAYHQLHISQLRATLTIAESAPLAAAADRFERYAAARGAAARAFAAKVAFRLVVPRNPLMARRLPWSRLRR